MIGKGILIGMFISLPIGPLGLLAIQRTINKGRKIGFLSGVGAAVSDMVYSSIAMLGISFLEEFLEKHKHVINKVTGILFLIVGMNILISAIDNKKIKQETKEDIIHPFLTHFLMGLSNPMTFLVFVAIFTKMHITNQVGDAASNIIFVISIFIGSSILWLIASNLVEHSKNSNKMDKFILIIDEVVGTVIIIIGIASMLKGILKL